MTGREVRKKKDSGLEKFSRRGARCPGEGVFLLSNISWFFCEYPPFPPLFPDGIQLKRFRYFSLDEKTIFYPPPARETCFVGKENYV